MRKPEQLLWDAMKQHTPAALWLQRVENVVGEGMPDVYVGCSGKWVELKAAERIPIKSTTPLLGRGGMRQSQINWHLKNASLVDAPLSYVLVSAGKALFLLRGHLAMDINEFTFDDMTNRSCADTWDAITKELS